MGVLLLCMIAILNFSLKSRVDKFHVGLFDKIYSAEEKIQFYNNIDYGGFTETEIENLISDSFLINVDIEGNTLILSGTSGDLSIEYQTPIN
jgi:hypothetical protein